MAGRVGRRVYRSRQWRAVRLAVFRRDGWRCVECGRRSGLECDHVREIETGGDWFAMDNLRTLCRACHLLKNAAKLRKAISAPRLALRDMAINGSLASSETSRK